MLRPWIRLSHALVKPAQDTSHKVFRARVNTLLLGADRLLLTPRADTLESYLMSKLSDVTFDNTYRAIAFARAIRFCLERHLFDVALVLHHRMRKEGFLAVHALSLRLTALDLARGATNWTVIVPSFKKLFEKHAYDVPALTDLVHYLSEDKRAPGALVDELARAFVSIRQIKLSEYPDLVGLLASVNMRTDRLDAAQAWIKRFEDACDAQGVLPDVTPYSHVISTLNDIDPRNIDAIQDVLLRMKSASAPPDTTVFNALIRANFVQQRYQEGLGLYHVLIEKRSDELMPNDVTFKLLFRAANVLNHPRLARRCRHPENAVPPRQLFHQMLVCHLEQTKGRLSERATVVSVSACHLALRTFMAREDYAAAFITIRALSALGFQPNLQTYLIVFVNLLHRMKYETNLPRPEGSYRLVDFLTHLRPNEDPDLHVLLDRIRHQRPGSSAIGTQTITHLLRLVAHSGSTDDALPDVPGLPPFPQAHLSRRHTQTPTIAMLTGAEVLPSDQRLFFSPIPLARIVHHALLGELFRKAVHRDADWDWKGAVRPIIEETEREMIPRGIAVAQASAALERRSGGRSDVLPFAAARMRRRRRSARGGREIAFDFETRS